MQWNGIIFLWCRSAAGTDDRHGCTSRQRCTITNVGTAVAVTATIADVGTTNIGAAYN